VEALQTLAKHRSIALIAKALGCVNHPTRVDPEQVAVIRKVVDRAQRKAIDHRGHPFRYGRGFPAFSAAVVNVSAAVPSIFLGRWMPL
jgi:hypothetical protein